MLIERLYILPFLNISKLKKSCVRCNEGEGDTTSVMMKHNFFSGYWVGLCVENLDEAVKPILKYEVTGYEK